jgi:predicted nucleic-acid-binding Zn-ribbon protein
LHPFDEFDKIRGDCGGPDMTEGSCPKCGCTVLVDGVRILDHRYRGSVEDLSVAVYKNPSGWVFKGEVRCRLWARVCGNCGYTELYAENPTDLVRAAAEAQGPSGEPDPNAGPNAEAGG